VLTAFVLASGTAGVSPQASRRERTGCGRRGHPRSPSGKARYFGAGPDRQDPRGLAPRDRQVQAGRPGQRGARL